MIALPGYTVSGILHEGDKSIVYRGIKDEQQAVIFKVLKATFPTLAEISGYKQEYQIVANLQISGVVKAYALEKYQSQLILVLEDFGGESLQTFLDSEISIADFLGIAIQLATTLGEIHQQNIIHKDIKPRNIIINPQTGETKITDFSIASRLSRENPQIGNLGVLEGTLYYISPEQTGRMNRVIDYRSDLYSLGVTFYQMLTGVLPFTSADPLELLHSHIAKQPLPPHQLRSDIPEVISRLVMKLLAKNAEDRYHTAFGVSSDLQLCQQLLTTGKISDFAIAQQDFTKDLLIPEKLYGRSSEVNSLLQAFERVSQGASELLLVSGYSGIGKTSLVNEIHKPILQRQGYFISGKFDQLHRDIPYDSVIQAFRSLMQQLLTESASSLEVWKAKLLSNLGENAQVIIEVIPELELIIGSQPPLAQLSATAAETRFNRVFIEFVRVFAQANHPLVLFLDDLQWADSASLKLMQVLLAVNHSNYLLLLGAYRDHEVSPVHPLMQTLQQMKHDQVKIEQITLTPLALNHFNQLITDTLQAESTLTQPLAELIFQKTHGNPFFFRELLKSLVVTNLLKFDFNHRRWQWDIHQIQTVDVTDNVVDLMSNNIKQLPDVTQNLLKLAACIGNKFDLGTLAAIHEKTLLDTAQDIWLAMLAGLIIPLSSAYKIPLVVGEETIATAKFDQSVSYKFLHDRVQQAAYALIPEADKKSTHLKIGQLLLRSQSDEVRPENIFGLVNHLNFAIDLIPTAEKKRLAELNLIVGNKAVASTAYKLAGMYLNIGLSLLPAGCWQHYQLSLELYDAAIAVECINAEYARSQALIDLALPQTQTLIDSIRIYKRQIQLFISQGNLPQAINTALSVLSMLNIIIPTDPVGIEQYSQQLQQELVFAKDKIAELATLPVMSDPEKQAAIEILNTMPGPVYIVRPELFMPMMITMTSLSVKYGNWVPSSFGYCVYGMLLCAVFGDIDAGYEFGQLSLQVLEQFNDQALYPHVLKVYSTHIDPCKNHIQSAIASLQVTIEKSVATGNIEFLGYATGELAMYLFFSGENLEIINQKILPYIQLVESFRQELGINYLKIAHQIILNLLTDTSEPLILTGESFSEEMLPILEAANWKMLLCCFYLFKLILAYLFKDYPQARIYAQLTANHLEGVLGMMMADEYNFYNSLVLLQGENMANDRLALHQVQANQQTLKVKALHAPMNFQHKYELVEAEIARVTGNIFKAMEFYDTSIDLATTHGYIQEAALANELAAEFYLTIGRERTAKAYLTDAYRGYLSWSAFAKAKDLAIRYPDLIAAMTPARETSLTSTGGTPTALFDLATVVKASQAIAGEIVLENLLNKLIKIVIENAGAQSGFLVAVNQSDFCIQVAGTAEQNQVVLLPLSETNIAAQLPLSVLNYVLRTKETLVLNNASNQGFFTTDPYIIHNQPKSILCTPIIYQGQLKNILYLQNNLTTAAFTVDRLEVLRLLSAQIAVSLENADLYSSLSAANTQLEVYSQSLEATVVERTQELQQKNASLEKITQQLKITNQELETFSYSVSHDLRAPLRRIDNFSKMILQVAGDGLNAQIVDYLQRIQNANGQMAQLIEDLLLLSQINRYGIRTRQVDLTAMVTAIAQTLQQAEPDRQVEWQIQPDVTANADPRLLHVGLENLLSNAWKYTRKQLHPKIEFGMASSGVYFIRDNGAGFNMKYINQLFKAFQRLHSASEFEGNGIGLATVLRVIQRHGGEIWAEGAVEQGATFYFTLLSVG